ncbi:MAG: hypothetical protein AB7N80_15995 [Bdellovibrionales bacterium]
MAIAQESLDTTVEVTFERNKGAVGQKEVFDRAIEKVSNQYIEQLIGEAKAAKNQGVIKNRIVKNSGKYILFIKANSPQAVAEILKYPVSLKISVKNLETLLLQEGLLYKADGPPKLLPMVTVLDRVNSQSYSWWNPGQNNAVMADLAKRFHLGLRRELRSRGFFGLEPIGGDYRQMLPTALHVENPATEDLLLLSEFYRAQVVARGQVIIAPERTRADVFKIEVRMSALHATNGRVIGEVIRTYNTEPGPFQQVVKAKLDETLEKLAGDLATQILEAWKSGTFGAALLNVAISGDLNYQQIAQFKKLLLGQVKDLKTLKERLFEPGRVTFETDSAANSEQLASSIRQKTFPRFQVSVSDVTSAGIELKVTAK